MLVKFIYLDRSCFFTQIKVICGVTITQRIVSLPSQFLTLFVTSISHKRTQLYVIITKECEHDVIGSMGNVLLKLKY